MVHFHLGKINKMIIPGKDVISSDSSVHAIVEMWDNNQMVLRVEDAIAEQAKESDVVVVDYNPISNSGQAVPKQTIVKILKGKKGKECWESFKKYHEEKNKIKNGEFTPEPPLSGIPYSR